MGKFYPMGSIDSSCLNARLPLQAIAYEVQPERGVNLAVMVPTFILNRAPGLRGEAAFGGNSLSHCPLLGSSSPL